MSLESALRTFLLKADGQQALEIQRTDVEKNLVELHLRETYPDFAYAPLDELEPLRLAARGDYVRSIVVAKKRPGQKVILLGSGFSLLGFETGNAIEVDLPAVASKKDEMYKRLEAYRGLRVIGANLDDMDFSDLRRYGSTLIVAEGISYYLRPATNERLFHHTAETGSTVIFDYFTPDVGPSSRYPEATRVHQELARANDAVVWTADPQELPTMLSTCGLQLISNVPMGDIVRSYRASSSHNPWAYVAVARSEK